MKLQRKYILQYLCILVLAAIGVMNVIEADYLRALTSAIYVFICVQIVFAGYRFADLGHLLDNANTVNKDLHDELDEVYEQRDAALRRQRELEALVERNRQDSIKWRDEKNKIEKECNRIRQENRHLTAEIERLNPKPRPDTSSGYRP